MHDCTEVSFHEENAAAWTDAKLDDRLAQDALIPFDLETGPVLRVSLFMRSASEHVLLLVYGAGDSQVRGFSRRRWPKLRWKK